MDKSQEVQQPQVRLNGVPVDVEFGTVRAFGRNLVTVICLRLGTQPELNRRGGRRIEHQKGMPTFLRSINPYLKLKTEIVFHPQSGIWGLKCFYDRALRENSVEPGSPTVVQFTMPNAPVLTTEEQARFGRTQLEKFALRKQKFFQLSSGMAQQCANVEVRA